MGQIEIRTFDGDLEALRKMAHDSWFFEYGDGSWPDIYKQDLNRFYFDSLPDPRFLVAAYYQDQIVAFLANLPRRYRLEGKTYLGVVSCLFAAHPDYRGTVIPIVAECLKRNHDLGADFSIFTLEWDHRSQQLFQALPSPYRIENVLTVRLLVHGIRLDTIRVHEQLKWYEVAGIKLIGAHRPIRSPGVPGIVRPYQESDLETILAITQHIPDEKLLVRVFDLESLALRLGVPGINGTVVYERDGAVAGFINYSIYDMVNPRGRNPWAWIDMVCFDGLTGKEKQALLAGVWCACRDAGCIGILEWTKHYYPLTPMYKARFIPYPRGLDVLAWIFNPDLSFKGVKGVFEQFI
jgi:hypothetical protein